MLPLLRRGTLAERIADEVRRRILYGDLRPGERMESLRELSRQLGVGVGAVREGISQLKGEGLVEVRHGVGTFVARRPRAARIVRAARRRAHRREVAELRELVDPALARAAARRATPFAIGEIVMAAGERQLALLSADAGRYARADLAFHLAVSRASRNSLGIGIYRMAATLAGADLGAHARAHAGDSRLNDLHMQLADAIHDGHERAAERAARQIAQLEFRPP